MKIENIIQKLKVIIARLNRIFNPDYYVCRYRTSTLKQDKSGMVKDYTIAGRCAVFGRDETEASQDADQYLLKKIKTPENHKEPFTVTFEIYKPTLKSRFKTTDEDLKSRVAR